MWTDAARLMALEATTTTKKRTQKPRGRVTWQRLRCLTLLHRGPLLQPQQLAALHQGQQLQPMEQQQQQAVQERMEQQERKLGQPCTRVSCADPYRKSEKRLLTWSWPLQLQQQVLEQQHLHHQVLRAALIRM